MKRMTRLINAEPRHRWLGFIVLSILGVLGNALSVPLFFGVDVIFGSIASLIAIAWLGPRLGIAVTVISAGYTFFMWNHFYAATVFIAEGVFVALLLRRLSGNLTLAVTLFWILIGIPLHAAFYYYGLGMDPLGMQLATIKQATSGIFNSILASLVLSYAPFLNRFRTDESRIPVYQHIFNIFVGAALVPAAILLVLDARAALNDIESSAMARLETVSTGISQATQGFLQQQKNAVLSVAWQIEEFGSLEHKRIQPLVESIRHIWTDSWGAFVGDENARTIAFSPILNSKGQSTLGLDLSDRAYFKALRDGYDGVYVSNVYEARGGVAAPVFNVTAGIRINGQFKGIVSSAVKVRDVLTRLHDLLKDSVFQATLVDGQGNVIISDSPEYKPMTPYAPQNINEEEPHADGFYYRLVNLSDTAPMSRWKKSFLGMRIDLDEDNGNWKIFVEQPMAPMRVVLYERYIRNMVYLLSLSLVILFSSMIIAKRIAQPLAQLSKETTDLPRRLQQDDTIDWPTSTILELNTVTDNFKSMVNEFKNRFLELEASRNQLKAAKDEAETANRMKSSFLANMSHEIRTPLGIMVGFTDLLLEEGIDLTDKQEFARGLKRNANQLSLLIDDILDLSKVEAGHMSLQFSEFSIRQMMKDLVVDFTPKALKKNLEIQLQVTDEVPDRIVSDSARLKQVLVNLIGNAMKFTSEGRIDLRVSSKNSHICIDVCDQGLGISPDDQEKLFKPFSQADESLTRKYGGTGLGLALSKRLSKLLGGDLRLIESTLGKGSTFQLSIPHRHMDAGQSTKPVASAEDKLLKPLQGSRVLLVEDSVDNQMLIAHLLGRVGAKVDIANNGQEGIEMATRNDYEFVLMDLQMPVVDGLTAVRILRDRGYTKPVIALTAHAMSEFREKCLEAGFDAHVPKPIHFDELVKAMSSIETSGHSLNS